MLQFSPRRNHYPARINIRTLWHSVLQTCTCHSRYSLRSGCTLVSHASDKKRNISKPFIRLGSASRAQLACKIFTKYWVMFTCLHWAHIQPKKSSSSLLVNKCCTLSQLRKQHRAKQSSTPSLCFSYYLHFILSLLYNKSKYITLLCFRFKYEMYGVHIGFFIGSVWRYTIRWCKTNTNRSYVDIYMSISIYLYCSKQLFYPYSSIVNLLQIYNVISFAFA